MDPVPYPDHEHLFKIYRFLNRKRIFELLFSLFWQKLDEPFRDKDTFGNLSFFNSLDFSYESNRFFFAIFG